jgi:hypothetical protein
VCAISVDLVKMPPLRALAIGIFHAVGDGRGQAQKILGVPCVDNLGIGFERAVAENRIVNRAAARLAAEDASAI